jgi:hypothetical protein
VKCKGWGWPTPYVLWTRAEYFDHVLGVSDPEVTLSNITTDYGLTLVRAELSIAHMNYSDQMSYKCIMVNDKGSANSTTYVRVKS